MIVADLMTRECACVTTGDNLSVAAGKMWEKDCGAVPVLEGDVVVGMLTDRDIVVQVVADGDDPRTTLVRDVMTAGSICVNENQSVDEAVALMQKYQVRRLPVVDAAGELVGIVSLGDIAVDVHAGLSGQVLKEVSEPAVPRL